MGFQAIELIGVATLLVIGFLLLQPWTSHLRRAHPGLFWAATIVVVAGIAVTLRMVLRDDFFPDGLEPIGRAALLVGVVGGGVLLSRRELG
jgi:hypothetical protein